MLFARKTEQIANGRFKPLPVREYLLKQGRFAHFVDEDIEYFQSKQIGCQSSGIGTGRVFGDGQ